MTGMLFPIFNSKSSLPMKSNCIQIYQTYIRSFITIGGPVWGPCLLPSSWIRIERLPNICLRITFTSSPYVANITIRDFACLKTLKHYIYQDSKNLLNKVTRSSFQHGRTLGCTMATTYNQKKICTFEWCQS